MNSKYKCMVIAEIGMNHNGSLRKAKRLVKTASKTGVDAVKLQMHMPEHETLQNAPAPKYFTKEKRWEFFKRTAFSYEEWKDLKKYVEKCGMEFICSPFSEAAIELLNKLHVKRYKVPSGEVTNIPYLETMAKTGKQILLTSGMNNWKELDNAVKTITKYNRKLTVLQCTSSYPCAYEEVGLNILENMKKRYGLPVGLSDHTLTLYASLAAVSLGAVVVERHFTISKDDYGPDAKFSLDPEEMKELVRGIRAIECMKNSPVNKDNTGKFKDMKKIFEKSIVAKRNIRKGTVITKGMLDFKKPGDGIRADRYKEIIGKKVKINIPEDTKLSKTMFN